MVMGDFNIDIERDGDKADKLLEWMDSGSLRPVIPDSNTSLRSNRIIDYALSTNIDLSMQTYEGITSSDHKPLLGVFTVEDDLNREGTRTIWSVFSLVLAYTYDYWEQKEWNTQSAEFTYENFISFLTLLSNRCQQRFPLNRARPSVPQELRKLLAQSRSLSYKAQRKGDIELRNEARRLRNFTRFELKRYQQEQLTAQLNERYSPGEGSNLFWNKTKRHFKHISSSLRGFTTPSGDIIKDPQDMSNIAADYYEKLFEAPVVMRPHPYIDAPPISWDNASDLIPNVTYPEIINILNSRRKKRSLDIHGLSPLILDKIPRNYWHLLAQLYNYSFADSFIPKKCKEVRMVLLAKKNAICTPDLTRPISLLDSFLKVQERLFLTRFIHVLKNRGILPDNQSGFRAGFRLQTRVLLLIEQISSYMANSSPVATVFVDFKSAFDQLWFEGCLGKLISLGVPLAYVKWIQTWLLGRKATIEVQGKRSRWIEINRGGPQGSSLTPSLFITYHSDMADYIPGAMSFFFADDLAAVLAGQIGIRFTDQCIDLERRLQIFLDQLEYYSILAVQPINYSKTQAMFSARAVGYPNPMPKVQCGDNLIEWISMFKYLGYWLTTKLGWGNMLGKIRIMVRQKTALVNSFKISGTSSSRLRRVLFSTFVLPHFTWLFGIIPLLTESQRTDLNHLYFTLLKRILHCQHWEDLIISSMYKEKPLEDHCYRYWEKYLKALSKTRDGYLLLEQSKLNTHRSIWQEDTKPIRCLRKSKRFVHHTDVFGQATQWMVAHGTTDSIIRYNDDEFTSFALFPDSFIQ
ncbi:unnamed protein product [Rotaria magnacalcarata]|uniref:Reverse transcriptase domain-containing protein n=4 Tax=Rotaria magnacalcarata TaxID=392030 RepID=A0A815BL63_9BILA|nr:unnamed protein product [Rotaria magnacalcarata]